jgi:thiamine-monophosphate kinase
VPEALAADAHAPIGSLAEQALIARIRARAGIAPAWLHVGIGDDAAVVAPVRNELDVVTTDVMIEGVHFDLGFMGPVDVGHRALAANLSDLAAMGASPRYVTLSIAAPPALPLATFDGIVDGFLALASAEGVALVGGNLSRSPGPVVVDVLAVGTVRPRRVLTRGGARPGDLVFVTGRPGEARAGLELCRSRTAPPEGIADPRARFLRPSPRVRLGMLLGRTRTASACMDLSDGLADAAAQVAAASGAGIEVDAAALPVEEPLAHWWAERGLDPAREAVAGGDDYELLFTVPRKRRRRLRELLRLAAGVPVTAIGVVTRQPGAVLRRGDVLESMEGGFAHFGEGGRGGPDA